MIRRIVAYALEAAIGLTAAVIVMIVLAATVESVPFVYQGF